VTAQAQLGSGWHGTLFGERPRQEEREAADVF
jgi:hypothetical protein